MTVLSYYSNGVTFTRKIVNKVTDLTSGGIESKKSAPKIFLNIDLKAAFNLTLNPAPAQKNDYFMNFVISTLISTLHSS